MKYAVKVSKNPQTGETFYRYFPGSAYADDWLINGRLVPGGARIAYRRQVARAIAPGELHASITLGQTTAQRYADAQRIAADNFYERAEERALSRRGASRRRFQENFAKRPPLARLSPQEALFYAARPRLP